MKSDSLETFGPIAFAALLDEHPKLAERLAANNEAKERGETHWVCPPGEPCYRVGPLNAQQQDEVAQENARALRRRVLASGVPANYIEANFETNSRGEPLIVVNKGELITGSSAATWAYGTRGALTACRSLSERWKPGFANKGGYNGLVLQSPGCGLGKTYLLCALLVRLTARGQRGAFIKCEELLSMYRASFNHNGEGQSAQQIFEHYSQVPLLILDELGGDYIKQGEAGDWARSQFLRLLDTRLDLGLTTLGSTNGTQSDLEGHYGGRTVSRLAKSMLIPMDGPDFRRLDAEGGRLADEDDPFADAD